MYTIIIYFFGYMLQIHKHTRYHYTQKKELDDWLMVKGDAVSSLALHEWFEIKVARDLTVFVHSLFLCYCLLFHSHRCYNKRIPFLPHTFAFILLCLDLLQVEKKPLKKCAKISSSFFFENIFMKYVQRSNQIGSLPLQSDWKNSSRWKKCCHDYRI